MFKTSIAAMLLLLAAAGLAMAEDPRIQFPADYATKFKNYISLDRVQNADQIISLYANDAAVAAAVAGGEMPSGAVLVGEVYAAKKDKDGKVIVSSLGRRVRDKKVAVAVMEKGTGWGKDFPDDLKNGDWDFAIFSPDGKRLDKDLNTCRQCHAPLKDTQHMFSLEHVAH